jgi:hypothetical protein
MTMKMKNSPLTNLATASLTGDALIRYLASQLLKNNVRPPRADDSTYYKGKDEKASLRAIRDAVRAAGLPRGQVKKTEATVAEEMTRQLEVRRERAQRRDRSFDPQDTKSAYYEYFHKDKYRRMAMVVSMQRGEPAKDCIDFLRLGGHLFVLLNEGFNSGNTLLTKHPGGAWTETRLGGQGHKKITVVLMEMAGYLVPREVLLGGAAVSFNLCRAVFVVTHTDGRIDEIPFNECPVEVCCE